jgi:hypothetical protein
MRVAVLLAVVCVVCALEPWRNTSLPISDRVEDLISRLTLEEKAGQLLSVTDAIPRLQIPTFDWRVFCLFRAPVSFDG